MHCLLKPSVEHLQGNEKELYWQRVRTVTPAGGTMPIFVANALSWGLLLQCELE